MKVHFIAIGGAAMHNLALTLHLKGFEVSGSDDAIFDPSKARLKSYGILPEVLGWFPEKITSDLDAIILGMHAKIDNPELIKAQALGVKIFSYPEFIYEQSKEKTRVVIGGSHGKTTITAMILHVLDYHGRTCDYMVGAQLEGFDVMVQLSDNNDFIVLEGDEYLSSPLDLRPKFHHYKPNIALVSGIAWDHINVFPTFENYKAQFSIFVDSIVNGGSISYNEEDAEVRQIVEYSENPIRKFPYKTPKHNIEAGVTYLESDEGPIPLEVFGAHNLNNLAGAKWICQHMGIDEADFHEAIGFFSGASKRLEKIVSYKSTDIYKDFAHAPSKVTATTIAVKSQYPNRHLIACLELHTFSSLNESFLNQYRKSLSKADEAIIFYSSKNLKIKNMKAIDREHIQNAFNHQNLKVFNNIINFQNFLMTRNYSNTIILLMSSGDFGGFDLESLKNYL
jgi:UDP-N-acetylmuramate: L-alanyl-gamma-D-glutamyl-meso-diaminopimelate ligase